MTSQCSGCLSLENSCIRRIRDEPATYRSAPPRAERVIKATRCDWLLATTNVDFARALHNIRLTDSIFESVRCLLSWSGQQHTNVLASLRPAYITQLVGVSRQIIRHLGVSRLMYARHNVITLWISACRTLTINFIRTTNNNTPSLVPSRETSHSGPTLTTSLC